MALWQIVGVFAAVFVLALSITGVNAASNPAASPTSGFQLLPAVAFDGADYLIVWQDGRGMYDDIYAARVSPAGAVLDPGGFAISTANREQLDPKAAFDGTNYLVAWTDYRAENNTDIYAARVSPAGAVLDPGGIPISTAAGFQSSPALAFDGTNYFVAWSENDGIRGTRVSPAGAVLDPGGIAISTGRIPALAFDGTNYLVAWNQNGYDIYGARVSPAGSVLDPGGFPISTGMIFRDGLALAFNGANYLAAWQESQSSPWDLYGARVSPDGGVLDPDGIAISTATYNQQNLGAASDGTNYLVVWQDSRTGTGWDIRGGRVSSTGTVLDPDGFAITTEGSAQTWPALAFGGGNYLVAWQGRRAASAFDQIYAARVTPAGTVLDPSGIELSPEIPPPPPLPPPPPPEPQPPRAKCVVPRVIGLKLAKARVRILRGKCRVGRIRRAHSRRVGRVLSQKPRAGSRRPFATRVNLVLGRR